MPVKKKDPANHRRLVQLDDDPAKAREELANLLAEDFVMFLCWGPLCSLKDAQMAYDNGGTDLISVFAPKVTPVTVVLAGFVDLEGDPFVIDISTKAVTITPTLNRVAHAFQAFDVIDEGTVFVALAIARSQP